MLIHYHVCDRCGKKITDNRDLYILQIRNFFGEEPSITQINRDVFELCFNCAKIAEEFYSLHHEEAKVMEKTKAAI
jgi:hypothetical protein